MCRTAPEFASPALAVALAAADERWLRHQLGTLLPAQLAEWRGSTDLGGMFELQTDAQAGKAEHYDELAEQLAALLSGETDPIANAANTSALLFQLVPDLNWAGFYFMKDGGLVLGPFQGKPACVRIPVGSGVCGTAVARMQSVLVDDVHAFPGHIACDAGSRSELVVPLIRGGAPIGVLDLDSPRLARFDPVDQAGIERVARLYLEASTDGRIGAV